MSTANSLTSLLVIIIALLCVFKPARLQAGEISAASRATVAKMFGADSASPSDADIRACLRSIQGSSDWNRLTGPIVRDLLDPRVSAEAWVGLASSALPEMRSVVLAMVADARLVGDRGLQRTLVPLAEVHRDLLEQYTYLNFAVHSGEKAKIAEHTEALKKLGEKKATLGGPIVQKLRDSLGAAEFEKALREAVSQSTAK